ncbi:hypothetical protein LTR41_004925 [Exophiala xenobiotica]|nr:hypothetical protein LTR41_004925 [Exophiala xenobiotica]
MIRRRAPKACIPCRNKKVKCDVFTSGTPCGNCTRAKTECTVNHARKRKGSARGDEVMNPPTGIHLFEVLDRDADPHGTAALQVGEARFDGSLSAASQSSDLALTSHLPLLPVDSHRNVSSQTQKPLGATNSATVDITFHTPAADLTPPPSVTFTRSEFPAFIKPLRPPLDAESLAFLEHKQAFSLPRAAVQREFMRSYIHYVHPFLPLLDLEDILLPLNDTPGSTQISVVLYQAVMFAAASFVSMEFLQKEGFSSQLDAHNCLFQRVKASHSVAPQNQYVLISILKLLVDFDVENDLLTLIKVLVLMTYWYHKPDDPKGRIYWMRNALSFAYEIGLDRDSELIGLDAKQQRSRRRLWWCCYARDKLISFSERRASGIRENENHLAVLTPDDFEPQLFSRVLRGYSAPGIITRPDILIELSIEHMKLCVLLGRVLDTQYLASGHRRTTTGETMMMLLPRNSETFMSDFMVRDQELSEWGEGICSRLNGVIDVEPERNCRLVSLHSAVLEMLYHTALSMLHRPLMALKHPTGSAAQALHDSSRQKLRDGARRITEIAKYLGDNSLLKHIPPIGVTALLAAAVQHVKDTVSRDTESHDAAVESFRQTMHALLQLREIYASAGHAISFIESVRERTTNNGANESNTEQKKILYPHGRMNYSTQGHQARGTTDSHADIASGTIEPLDGGFGLTLLSPSAESAYAPIFAGLGTPGAGPLDFETVSDMNSLSEILLSESFGVSDFDGIDWTSIFQGPDSMRF